MSITPRKPRNDAPQSIRLACRNCGVELIANARDAGKTATCPECGNRIAIPGRAARAREETPTPPGRPFPGQAARAEKESLKLQDEVRAEAAAKQPPPRPSEPNAPGREAPPKAAGGKRQTEAARTRARIAGWLRRAVIVVLALTVLKVFDATFAALVVRAPANLHAAVRGMGDALRAIPSDLHNLAVPRPAHQHLGALVPLQPLERFMLGLAMLIFATRVVVRTKLLDAVYVTSDRWRERTVSGLVIHALFLVILAALLAWAASCTWTPEASDGLTCGLIAATLWASALWLTTLHLVASYEYPELTKWMINDLTFGTLIFLVVLWPGLTRLWSRSGATAVLFLADSAVALHVGASFVFARRPSRWWWRKPLSLVVTFALLVLVAVILACSR